MANSQTRLFIAVTEENMTASYDANIIEKVPHGYQLLDNQRTGTITFTRAFGEHSQGFPVPSSWDYVENTTTYFSVSKYESYEPAAEGEPSAQSIVTFTFETGHDGVWYGVQNALDSTYPSSVIRIVATLSRARSTDPSPILHGFEFRYVHDPEEYKQYSKIRDHNLYCDYTNIDAHAIVDKKYLTWTPTQAIDTRISGGCDVTGQITTGYDFLAMDACKVRDNCVLICVANSTGTTLRIYAINPHTGRVLKDPSTGKELISCNLLQAVPENKNFDGTAKYTTAYPCDVSSPVRVNVFSLGAIWVTYRSKTAEMLISVRMSVSAHNTGVQTATGTDIWDRPSWATNQFVANDRFYPERKLACATVADLDAMVILDEPVTKVTSKAHYNVAGYWVSNASNGKFVSGDPASINTSRVTDINTASVSLISKTGWVWEKVSSTSTDRRARLVLSGGTGEFQFSFVGKTMSMPIGVTVGLSGNIKVYEYNSTSSAWTQLGSTYNVTTGNTSVTLNIKCSYQGSHTIKVVATTNVVTNTAITSKQLANRMFAIGWETGHVDEQTTGLTMPQDDTYLGKWWWELHAEASTDSASGYLFEGWRLKYDANGNPIWDIYSNGERIGWRSLYSWALGTNRYYTSIKFRLCAEVYNKVNFKLSVMTSKGYVYTWPHSGTEDDIIRPSISEWYIIDFVTPSNSKVSTDEQQTWTNLTDGLTSNTNLWGNWFEFRFEVCNLPEGTVYQQEWWYGVHDLLDNMRFVIDNLSYTTKDVAEFSTYRATFQVGQVECTKVYDLNPNLMFNDAYITTIYDEPNRNAIVKANLLGYWNGDATTGTRWTTPLQALNSPNQITLSKNYLDGNQANVAYTGTDVPGYEGGPSYPIWRPWISSDLDGWNFRGWWNESAIDPMPSTNCVAWVMLYVYSPRDDTYTLVHGADDVMRIYIVNSQGTQTTIYDPTATLGSLKEADLPLTTGWNKLFFKVANGVAGWKFVAKIQDSDKAFPAGMITNTEPYPVNQTGIISWQTKTYKATGTDFTYAKVTGTRDLASEVTHMDWIKLCPNDLSGTYSSGDTYKLTWATSKTVDAVRRPNGYGTVFSVTFDARWNFGVNETPSSGWRAEAWFENDGLTAPTYRKAAILKNGSEFNCPGYSDNCFHGNGYEKNLTMTVDSDFLSLAKNPGASRVSFVMVNESGTPVISDSKYFLRIENIRIGFMASTSTVDASDAAFTYIWLNKGGEVLDWDTALNNVRHMLWDNDINPKPERLAFLEWMGSLWCMHQSWTGSAHELNVTSLDNSEADTSSACWNTMTIYSKENGDAEYPYFTNLTWDYAKFGKWFIAANRRKDSNSSLEGGFFHTFHPTWVSERAWFDENPITETIVGFMPIFGEAHGDTMYAITAQGNDHSVNGNGKMFGRFAFFEYDTIDELYKEPTYTYCSGLDLEGNFAGELVYRGVDKDRPVHFADFVTDMELSRGLEFGSDNGVLELFNASGMCGTEYGLFNLHESVQTQADPSDLPPHRKIVPTLIRDDGTYDREPRLLSFYMSSHPEYVDPYFKTLLNPAAWGWADSQEKTDEWNTLYPDWPWHKDGVADAVGYRACIEPYRVFTGILGRMEQNHSYKDQNVSFNIYGYGYQLQQFCTPETLIYAAPAQDFFDDFADVYQLEIDRTGYVKLTGLNEINWPSAGVTGTYEVNMLEKYARCTSAGYMRSKGELPQTANHDAVYACEVYLEGEHGTENNNHEFTIGYGIRDSAGNYSYTNHDRLRFRPSIGDVNVMPGTSTSVGSFHNITIPIEKWTRIAILVLANSVSLFINGEQKGNPILCRGWKGYRGTDFEAFTFTSYPNIRIRNPRIERYTASDIQKTDLWVAESALGMASQCTFPVTVVCSPEDVDPLIGPRIWAIGTDAAKFISDTAKRNNKLCYFDNYGRFIWKRYYWDGKEVCTLSSRHIRSMRFGYSNFDYVNWVSVYSDGSNTDAGKPINERYGDAYSISNDGVRFKFVEDSSIESAYDGKLRALAEYYSFNDGLETLSVSLGISYVGLNPGDIIAFYVPEVGLNYAKYMITKVNYSYSHDSGISVDLELDSQIKAMRQLVSDQLTSTYIGMTTQDQSNIGNRG